MALLEQTVKGDQVDNHDQDISSIVEELNRRDNFVYDPTLKLAQSGTVTFTKDDFTQNNTNNPRNPWIDWTGAKTITHNLGFLPVVRGTFIVTPFYSTSHDLWTLPQLPFQTYDNSVAGYYGKVASGVYITPGTSNIVVNFVGNFFNPLAGASWGGTDQTAIITYYIFDQPVNV